MMIMKPNLQELIAEVARRHNVLLGPDDPIFISLTLNELILRGYMNGVEAAMEAQFDKLSTTTIEQTLAAKEISEILITKAAEYADGQIRLSVNDLINEFKIAMGEELEAIAKTARATRTAYFWSMGFAVFSLVIAVVLIGCMLIWFLHR